MLQQTTVATVVPYFERFVARFPDVASLAAAEQDQVLRMWEGLGYYSRARNLQKAARVIVEEFNGKFPETAEELRTLPGIGPYTAGAIASFAFNQPAGILEANTLRLYSRLIELDIDPRGSAGQKILWKFANWIVSRRHAADFNQAVMDLGSQVCRPTDPDCRVCPLMPSCKSLESGRQDQIPLEKARPKITDVVEAAIAIRHGNRFLLRQYQEGERWTGLWDFVRFEVSADAAAGITFPPKRRATAGVLKGQRSLFQEELSAAAQQLPGELRQRVEQLSGITVNHYAPIAEIRHAVTRYRIRLLCLSCVSTGGRIRRQSGYQWCAKSQLAGLPLSTTARQFADQLTESR